MPALFPDVRDASLSKLCNSLVDSLKTPTGTVPTAFTDRLGQAVSTGVSSEHPQAGAGREVKISLTINPDGLTAFAKITVKTPTGVQSVGGTIDTSVLATKLV